PTIPNTHHMHSLYQFPYYPELTTFFFLLTPPPPRSTLFPYTTLFRSRSSRRRTHGHCHAHRRKDEAGGGCRGQLRRRGDQLRGEDRKSTRLNSSHRTISYAVFCLKKKR